MREWAIRHWPALLVLALVGAVAFPATWSGELADLGGDSALYLLAARHFAPYAPADPVAQAFAADSQFPPLYPLVLALGGGALDLHVAHAVTTVCLLGALAAFYATLLGLGLSRPLAVATVVLFVILPGTVAPALQLKSESLYLALSLGGLALLSRAARSNRLRDYWLATALLAAALMTRSVGLALLPALLVVLARQRPRNWLWMPVALLAPAIAWRLLWSPAGYESLLRVYVAAPPEAVLARLVFNLEGFLWGLAGNVLQTQALFHALVPVALVSAGMLVWRFYRLQPDAWYLAAYLAMLVVWPYPGEGQRFGWVIMPWLLAYAVLAADQLAHRFPDGALAAGAVRWSVPAVVALLVVPAFHLTLQRALNAPDPSLARLPEWYGVDSESAQTKAQGHLDIVQAIAEFGSPLPKGECIYAIKATVVALLTGHGSRFPPVERTSDAEFEAWVEQRQCRYFLLIAASDGDAYRSSFYPHNRLADRLEILAIRESGPAASRRIVAALAVSKP